MPNVYQFKDFEGSSHRILIDLVTRFGGRGGSLVDLGAAGGELGSSLRGQFDRTFGFEYNVSCIADLLPRFDGVMISDLEHLKRLPGRPRVVVLADVLEHLRNPSALLRLVREGLAEDGTMFVSVPNIANITIRIGLLFGVFEYRERGILDHTHLRFYTMRTIRKEIEAAGFHIVAVRGSSVPIRLIVGSFVPEPLLRAAEKMLSIVTSLLRGLFAYQIILVARPER